MKTSHPKLVPLRYKIIRVLPISRIDKIAMERKLINQIFRHKVQVAKAAGEGAERIESIRFDHWYELDMLSEEEELIRSNSVLALARSFDLPIPARPDVNDENEDWQSGQYYYRQTLSQVGRAKLRESIRKERKERHEGWTRWMPFVTALIAAGGIVATILTRR